MERIDYRIMVLIATICIITAFVGCKRENNTQNTFNLEDFINAVEDKGYNYGIQDVQKDFLPATRKRMIFDDIAIDIYLFSSDEKMESVASNIDSSGGSYNESVFARWVSFPHFYKEGCLIVQYVGKDENIISDLKDIFGKQFTGHEP